MQTCLSLFTKKGQSLLIGGKPIFSNEHMSGWVDLSFKSGIGTTSFRVNNDISSYSSVDLTFYHNKILRGNKKNFAGLTLWKGQDVNGNKFNAFTNYTANDLATNHSIYKLETPIQGLVGLFVGVQIHELGVSLSKLTGNYPKANGTYQDTDSGMAYEECVYNKLKSK
jgi:hypothetical protein